MLFLSFISLISIGFSSWNIGENKDVEAGILISADDIQTYNIITIRTPNYSFKISQDGMVENQTIVTQGLMSFPFAIDNGACQSYLSNGQLRVVVTLREDTNTTFRNYISDVTCSYTGCTVSNYSSSESNAISRLVTLTPSQEQSTIVTIKYTVKDSNNGIASFYNNIPSFSFIVSLEAQ